MTLKLIDAPATEPVALADARLWCRIDDDYTAEDTLVQLLIKSARERAEHLTGRRFVSQTWELVLDAFPTREIELAARPVQSITSVVYIDSSGVQQTLSPALYVLDDATDPAFLLPAINTDWPATLDTINAVRVRFVQGWGDGASSVPAALREWMHLQVATAWKFRERIVAGMTIAELPSRYVDGMLDPYRVWEA